MIAGERLIRESSLERDLWLYDTYTGLLRPDPEMDIDVLGNRAINGWEPRNIGTSGETLWVYADEVDVRANMATTGYPKEKMHFIKGMIYETIPARTPDQISMLRIDTDWYASYKHALHHLYDWVSSGGFIILDYGQFLGARQALDEFIAKRAINTFLLPVDFSCRMMIKP